MAAVQFSRGEYGVKSLLDTYVPARYRVAVVFLLLLMALWLAAAIIHWLLREA